MRRIQQACLGGKLAPRRLRTAGGKNTGHHELPPVAKVVRTRRACAWAWPEPSCRHYNATHENATWARPTGVRFFETATCFNLLGSELAGELFRQVISSRFGMPSGNMRHQSLVQLPAPAALVARCRPRAGRDDDSGTPNATGSRTAPAIDE